MSDSRREHLDTMSPYDKNTEIKQLVAELDKARDKLKQAEKELDAKRVAKLKEIVVNLSATIERN